jgi:hypothetical protein
MRAFFPFVAAFLVCIPTTFAAPAAKPMTICLTESTGAVVARPKCRKGEVVFNARSLVSTLSGPQWPQGVQGTAGPQGVPGPKGEPGLPGLIDTASCYVQNGEWQLTNDGFAFASAQCKDEKSEFMMSDGMEVQPSSAFLDLRERSLWIPANSNVPTGIDIATQSATSVYQLRAVIVCCKR